MFELNNTSYEFIIESLLLYKTTWEFSPFNIVF